MTNTPAKVDKLLEALSTSQAYPYRDKQDALLAISLHLLHRAILQGNLEYVLQDFPNLIEREGRELLAQFDKRVEDDSVVAY